jgi:hypothetical protein
MQEQMVFEVITNQFAAIDDVMIVKEQPKPGRRARYECDGPRFLPDSKKHPMCIQVCFQDTIYISNRLRVLFI